MLCPVCRFDNNDSSAFCNKCGSSLSTTPGKLIVDSNSQPTKHSSGFPKVFGIVLIFIVLAVVGVGAIGGKALSVIQNGLRKDGGTATNSQSSGGNKASTVSQSSFGKLSGNTPSSTALNPSSSGSSALTADDQKDTDKDGIPDWIEVGAGMDPNRDQCASTLLECSATLKDLQKQVKNALIILDSSGSMAEKMSDGSVKMDVAKEEIKKMVEGLPKGINIAFMVYGSHGSNAAKDKAVSCAGIDVLHSLGEADSLKISQALSSFKPTGYTPIGASIAKAGDVFAGHESEGNYVFLASDGEETCGGNANSSVQALKATFSDLTIDVAGLSVNAVQRAQLEQIASLGGGNFYAINSKKDWENTSTVFKNTFATADYQRCISRVITSYTTCTMGEYTKSMNYVNSTLLNPGIAKFGSTEYQSSIKRVQDVSNKILDAHKSIKDKIITDGDTFIKLTEPYRNIDSNN